MDLDRTMFEMYEEARKTLPDNLKPAEMGKNGFCMSEHKEEPDYLWKCTKQKGHEDKLHVAHSSLGRPLYKWEGA